MLNHDLVIIHRQHRLRVAASVYISYGWKTRTFTGVNDGFRIRLITRWESFAFTVFWRNISLNASPFGGQTMLFSKVHRLRHVVKLRTPDHRNTGTPEHRNTKNDKDQRKNKLFKKLQLGKRFGFPLASSFPGQLWVTVVEPHYLLFHFLFYFSVSRASSSRKDRRLHRTDEDVRRFPRRNPKIFDFVFVVIFTWERYTFCSLQIRVFPGREILVIQSN